MSPSPVDALVPVRPVTRGTKHHWFGYYDKCPWDAAAGRMLVMEVPFADRMPKPDDTLALGFVDLSNEGRFNPFAETQSWCWQMGCMLQWLPPDFNRRVLYNVREKDQFRTVIHDLHTGKKRILPRATFALTPDGETALCINFSRLATNRPGYGYEGVPDPFAEDLTPKKDGVWRMDIASGKCDLVLSLAQLAAAEPTPDMAGVPHRIEHVQINTDGTRFALLHRYVRSSGKGFVTRLVTANMDGSDVYVLNPNRMTSHYDWRDPGCILAWARTPDSSKEAPVERYISFTDQTRQWEIVGDGLLTTDGHCSWSPDRRWVLSDTYPGREDPGQILFLYDPTTNRRVEIGRFAAPEAYRGDIRCDLHPRWSRDGKEVCFDSTMDGTRQLYIADVRSIVGSSK